MKIKKHVSILVYALLTPLLLLTSWVVPPRAEAARSIIFPVIGPARFTNDYYVPRPNGIHAATDVMANKGQQLVSVVDGTITYVAYPMPSWGYDVEITDSEGFTYIYLHINDDTPGTNDGHGGPMNAYAPDMKVGNRVVKGQHIGWVGDSGNSNGVPHLHFEIDAPDGSPVNPYDSLVQAHRIGGPVPYPQLANELLPYGPYFTGGINIAMGNFDADQQAEMVSGAGPGGGSHVRMFNDDNTPFGTQFFAYGPHFSGGADVATGDVDGDGTDEIITGAGPGGGPHVRIFRLDGSEVGGFYAYSPDFSGGIKVSAGDVDGDGTDEIITGAGPGGGPHVRIFRLDGSEVGGFYAYAPGFTGGIDIAASDVTGSSNAEVITSPGPGGGPHVRIFQANGTVAGDFIAYAPGFTGGVRISAGNVRTSSSKSEILTVPYSSGGPHIRMFDFSGALISEKMFLEVWWGGYYDVAAGYDASQVGTGTNRRASIRVGL